MARLKINDSKKGNSSLKISKEITKAEAKKAIKGSDKNTKIATLPTPPAGTEYFRHGDGSIGLREKKETFKPVRNYPYPRA